MLPSPFLPAWERSPQLLPPAALAAFLHLLLTRFTAPRLFHGFLPGSLLKKLSQIWFPTNLGHKGGCKCSTMNVPASSISLINNSSLVKQWAAFFPPLLFEAVKRMQSLWQPLLILNLFVPHLSKFASLQFSEIVILLMSFVVFLMAFYFDQWDSEELCSYICLLWNLPPSLSK